MLAYILTRLTLAEKKTHRGEGTGACTPVEPQHQSFVFGEKLLMCHIWAKCNNLHVVSFFRRPIWLHSWHFYTTRLQPIKEQQTSSDMLINRVSERRYHKKGSFSTTLCSKCKHSLNLTCHTHKRNETDVTKIIVVKVT